MAWELISLQGNLYSGVHYSDLFLFLNHKTECYHSNLLLDYYNVLLEINVLEYMILVKGNDIIVER